MQRQSHNICRAELLLELNDYRCVVEQQKQCAGEQNRVERGPAMLATRYCTKLVLSFDDTALKITAVSQPMRTLGTMQTIAVRRGLTLKSATPKVLIPKHWMKLVIPNTAPRKQSADRAEQNGSDDDRNRYKSYLDGSGFEITERCECHDDYQSGEQCGEHETHEFLPRCGS